MTGPDQVETWRQALRAHGGRVTTLSLRALEHLTDAPGHLSVAELHAQLLAGHPSISLSTVYRIVERLRQLGLVLAHDTPHGTAYEISPAGGPRLRSQTDPVRSRSDTQMSKRAADATGSSSRRQVSQ